MRLRLVRICAALLFMAVSLPVLAAPASAGSNSAPWQPWSQDYEDWGVVVTCVPCQVNLTFTNYSVDPVELTASEPFQPFSNPSQLSVTDDTCDGPTPVPSNGTCMVQVTFTPEPSQGPFSDQLQANFMDTVTDDPVSTPPVALFAGGTSYVATTLNGTVDFGDVPDGPPATFVITYNLWNWNEIIKDIPPDIFAPFTLGSNTCTSPTAVTGATNEAQCTMQVTFSPTSLGEATSAFDATFENSQTAATVWTEPLTLEGIGTAPTGGQVPEAPLAVLLPSLGLVALAGVGLVRRRRSLPAV